MTRPTLCPRCLKNPVGPFFYGPCDSCVAELREDALRWRVWRWLLGWITPGWGGPKDLPPEEYDEMARRWRASSDRRARR